MTWCNSRVGTYLLLIALINVQISIQFYLPGLAPKSFCKKNKESETCKSVVDIFVNRLDSVESVLPYEYTQ